MKASDRQVGGNHYRLRGSTGIDHWTYCDFLGLPYLESAATKYLVRWESKGGTQDIRKACHYLERRLQSLAEGYGATAGAPPHSTLDRMLQKGLELADPEFYFVVRIAHWEKPSDLEEVIADLYEYAEALDPNSAYTNQDR